MPSQKFQTIREAIQNKRLIRCTYHGYAREMSPHVLGWKEGRETLLSFQFGGASSKGLPPSGEWRCMIVEGIKDIRSFDGEWRTGANHSRPQTCVDNIDTEVKF